MSTPAWIALYAIEALWWLWVARWGGARVIEGGLASWLLHPVAWRWDAEIIAVFAWMSLFASTGWFLWGLVNPEVRLLAP